MSTSHGRNKKFCDRYKLENREQKNRERKMRRHAKQQAKKAAKLARRKVTPK